MRTALPALILALWIVAPAAAQVPEPAVAVPPAAEQSEQELEDEFIRTQAENGPSHASGGRPELGPVVMGNPTAAVVALRVSNPALPPTALPANFVLNNPSSIDVAKNADGAVTLLTVYGGGWGHNLGMSQYGAHGRGKFGDKFIEILKAYYTAVDVGSHPIDIGRDPGSGAPTLRQEFVAPNGLGILEIRATDLRGLRVHINGLYDLSFDETSLAADVVRVDVTPYLVTGLNVIQYNPVGRSGTATVSVIVQ